MQQIAEAPADEFLGLDRTGCCCDCGSDHCVITGDGVCGHPRKSGLQSPHKVDPEIVKRFNRARKYIAEQDVRQKDFGE